MNRWCFEILRLAFRDVHVDKQDRYSIYDEHIGSCSFAVLVVMTVPVIITALFITFWNIYMVEEQIGSDCSPHYDCFPMDDHDNILQDYPVSNCSSWPQDTDYKCYRLVYAYVEGVSATGGLMFFASVILKMYIATLLAPRKMTRVCIKWTCYCTVIAVGACSALLFVLLHATIPHPQSNIFRNETHIIQFIVYCSLLFVVFFITGPLLIFGIECDPSRRSSGENGTAPAQ